jgi:hypothetical protein
MQNKTIKRENDQRIDELEAAIVDNFELVECPVVHRFTDGMYIREIFMPKDSLLTSKIHNTNHPYTISQGVAMVQMDAGEWIELAAPYTGITVAGTRRVLYILEDCIWTTYHPLGDMKLSYNDLTEVEKQNIVDEIENEIIEPHQNCITGTNIHLDYKEKIDKNKIG